MDEWMTVAEVCKATDRTRQWVHDRIADGTFGCMRKAHGSREICYVRTQHVRSKMIEEIEALYARLTHLQDHIPLPMEVMQ